MSSLSFSEVSSVLGDVDFNAAGAGVWDRSQADCQIESSAQMLATVPTDIELYVDGNHPPITSQEGGNPKAGCFETPCKQQQDVVGNQSSISH